MKVSDLGNTTLAIQARKARQIAAYLAPYEPGESRRYAREAAACEAELRRRTALAREIREFVEGSDAT